MDTVLKDPATMAACRKLCIEKGELIPRQYEEFKKEVTVTRSLHAVHCVPGWSPAVSTPLPRRELHSPTAHD